MSTKKFSHLNERVNLLFKLSGFKQKQQFASLFGITPGYVTHLLDGRRETISDALAKNMSVVLGIDEEWLKTGEGSPPTSVNLSNKNEESFQEVKIFSFAGAGDPMDFSELPPIEVLRLPKEICGNVKHGVRVKGHSMVPTFPPGTYCGVDTNDKELIDGEAYCLWMQGYVIKRIEIKTDHILVKSDNPTISPESKPLHYLDDHFIIGRVAWWYYRRREE